MQKSILESAFWGLRPVTFSVPELPITYLALAHSSCICIKVMLGLLSRDGAVRATGKGKPQIKRDSGSLLSPTLCGPLAMYPHQVPFQLGTYI